MGSIVGDGTADVPPGTGGLTVGEAAGLSVVTGLEPQPANVKARTKAVNSEKNLFILIISPIVYPFTASMSPGQSSTTAISSAVHFLPCPSLYHTGKLIQLLE